MLGVSDELCSERSFSLQQVCLEVNRDRRSTWTCILKVENRISMLNGVDCRFPNIRGRGSDLLSLMEQFTGRRYISLETYTGSGKRKITPVQSLEHQGALYVRTDPTTWKIKRIQRNPRVRVALSDRSGKLLGNWIEGRARILDGEEKDRMLEVFKKDYGSFGYSMVGFVGRLRGEHQMNAIISIQLGAPMGTV